LLEGIKQEAGKLVSYSFVHVKRTCNEAAHNLAKSGTASLCNDSWFDQVPACIIDVVAREQRVPKS
jgi:hypothetical protein